MPHAHAKPTPGTDHDHGGHGHGHAHAHAPPAHMGRAYALGIALNVAFVAAEVVYGITGHSMALLADAGHNLGDILGLAVAAGAFALSQRPPSARFTYGLGSSSILAALFNAVVLLLIVGGLGWEAIVRLFHPEPVAGVTVTLVAAVGIAANGACALLFASGRHGDVNLRGAFLHMAADAAVSAGVVVSGLIIALTGWATLDPLVSLAVNAIIVWGTWSLLAESLRLALGAVPPGVDPGQVRTYLSALPGVTGLHDLHIWPISTTRTALTAHLVMPAGHPGDAFLMAVCETLEARHAIGHATLQIETDPATACALAPESVV